MGNSEVPGPISPNCKRITEDRWAEVTHGAKNGRSFSEMMGPSILN